MSKSSPPEAGLVTHFLYGTQEEFIDEKDFGKIKFRRTRVLEMNNWAEQIKNVEGGKEKGRKSEVRDAMITAQ